MKYVKPLFCLEILFVIVGCTRVYTKWDAFICSDSNWYYRSGTLYYFHFQQTKSEKSSSI